MDEDPVELLRRWEDFGAVWQVVARTPDLLTISLRRCDAGEEVSRLVSDDPALREYVDEHATDERGYVEERTTGEAGPAE